VADRWHCGGQEKVHRVWWGNEMEEDHLEDLDVDVRILKWILK
jgi:hypothetical protein